VALSKEVERALINVVQLLGDKGGREGCRRLVRALDGRVAALSPSLIERPFHTADIDAFAKSEGVLTRKDSEGAGQLLRRIRDALHLPSWPRLVALATEWNAGDAPEIDVARALQEPFFQWWNTADDPAQLVTVLLADVQLHRTWNQPQLDRASLAVIDLAGEQSGLWQSYLGLDPDEALDAARALLLDASEVGLRTEQRAIVRGVVERCNEIGRWPDAWLPTTEIARALAASLTLALVSPPDKELGRAALLALEAAEQRLRESRSYPRANKKVDARLRLEQRKQWSNTVRARGGCPELERWVAMDRAIGR
jgi:hypothetical protein